MTTVKEVWDFLVKLQTEAEDKKLTNEEILQIIGLFKILQTGLMLRMDSHKAPFEEEKK